MVGISKGLFRVILLTPKAKLLDCRAGSLVIPSQDGQWGILRNHCPVLAKLRLGIVQVREIPDRLDAYYILESGFVRVTENHVTVLGYDVITFEGKEEDEVQSLLSEARGIVAGQEYIEAQQKGMDAEHARLVVRMAEMAGLDKPV